MKFKFSVRKILREIFDWGINEERVCRDYRKKISKQQELTQKKQLQLLETEKEKKDYRSLLAENSIRPMALQLWTMNADGSNKKQVTNNNAANFGPFFFPDTNRIIFSSNMHDERGRDFDLYAINTDGTSLERITYFDGFDGFPMFSRDGKYLVFASNRNQKKRGETNIFLAEWR